MKDAVFRRNLDYYQSSHLGAMTAVDADCSNGELTIDLPPQTGPLIKGSFGLFSYCYNSHHEADDWFIVTTDNRKLMISLLLQQPTGS